LRVADPPAIKDDQRKRSRATKPKSESPQRHEGEKNIAVNRRARHDYFIEETFEAGLVLSGSEVKSLRDGKAQLKDSYGRLNRGELWLFNAHINEYSPAARFGHDPTRSRKLLMHRREIDRLAGKMKERGFALIPLRLYFKRGRAKVELGLARGKKLYDKRASIKERESKRELDRAMKTR
jgi:SsrA-binding protein